MKLTEHTIRSKTRNNNLRLEQLQNLNVCAQNLSDISILSNCYNIKVLSLVVNKISNLEPIANLKNLSELYLRENLVKDFEEIEWLSSLPLKILSLKDNPIAKLNGYRRQVISILPNLSILDDREINSIERNEALNAWSFTEEDSDEQLQNDDANDEYFRVQHARSLNEKKSDYKPNVKKSNVSNDDAKDEYFRVEHARSLYEEKSDYKPSVKKSNVSNDDAKDEYFRVRHARSLNEEKSDYKRNVKKSNVSDRLYETETEQQQRDFFEMMHESRNNLTFSQSTPFNPYVNDSVPFARLEDAEKISLLNEELIERCCELENRNEVLISLLKECFEIHDRDHHIIKVFSQFLKN